MTNEKAYVPVRYGCNGITTKFSFPFKIITKDDLIVQVQDSNGEQTTLNLDIDYSVEFEDVGGEITTAKVYDTGCKILISRNVSDFQSKDFTTSPGFQASEIEKAFDRVSCNLQEMDYNIENFKETFSAQVAGEIDELENTIEENKQEVLLIQERFEDEVNTKIQEVSEAAGKINALEQAVLDAQDSAQLAEQKANEANESLENLTSRGEMLIEDVSKEVTRVEKTVDELDKNIDKVINSVSFNLFDTKLSDRILEGNEAKGWALQGTYVSKELYPDFYNTCLAQKEAGVEKEVTLGESSLTMFINPNGHQFFNISDKQIVDDFYNAFGIADFYGVDEENERIFLPRNKYFHQLTVDISNVNQMIEAGLPNITGRAGQFQLMNASAFTGAFTYERQGTNNSNAGPSSNVYCIFDASLSNPIYGNSTTVQPPSSLKLLYYCVGNTVVNDSKIDAGALVSQMEQKANVFLDNVLPSSDFKNQVASYSCPDYQKQIILSVGTTEQTYTAPCNGWFGYSFQMSGNNTGYVKVNEIQVVQNIPAGGSYFDYISGIIPVGKNDVIKYYSNASNYTVFSNFAFYPMKGVN